MRGSRRIPKVPGLAARVAETSNAPPGTVVYPSSKPGTYDWALPEITPETEAVPDETRTIELLVMLPVWVIVLAPPSKLSTPLTAATGVLSVATVKAGE